MKITIGGMPGSGKSTIGKMLAEELNFEYFSGGQIFRDLTKELNKNITQVNKLADKDESLDKKTDDRQITLGETKNNFVLESRLAYFFIPDAYKIFLKVSTKVSIKRIMNRSNISLKEAQIEAITRFNDEHKRFEEKYKTDFMDEKNYDLIVDTDNKTIQEIIKIILKKIKK